VRVFLTKWMVRYIRKEQIALKALREAIARAERGLVDAKLGSGLIKQRVARAGKGRSGGYRTIIAYRRADMAFFLYGFAKSERENIEEDELRFARELGDALLTATEEGITTSTKLGELEEIAYDCEEN
jgi:hypothetical protein